MALGRQSSDLRRSLISVPASNEKMLEKSRSLAADQILFDWEDSVAPNQKEFARDCLLRSLATDLPFQAKLLSVRINASDSPWYQGDLAALEKIAPRLLSIVLPKVASLDQIEEVSVDLQLLEGRIGADPGSIGIDAQIESAIGLVHAAEIASHPRVLSLSFGPLDFLADIGVATSGELDGVERLIDFALCNVLVAARSAGKLAFDGPVVEFRDPDKFESRARIARSLGFDGKWVIHPNQVESCNRIFAPTQFEVERAEHLVKEYEAVLESKGAIEISGTMIDEASYRIAQRTLRRSRSFN